jgi:hypothetical protein
MRRFVISLALGASLLAASASATLAIGLHQHYLTTPSGEVVMIAKGICANDLQNAIDNLHEHFHLGAPTGAFAGNPITFTVGTCP